jgi:plasmid stabilization system protein ParE
MKSGYELFWSNRALDDLQRIIDYLTENWTPKEVKNFAKRLDRRLILITINPRLFPATKKRKNVRRSVLSRQTVIYYKTTKDTVTVIALFYPRQHPSKLKL